MSKSERITILIITLVLLAVGYYTMQVARQNDVRNSDASHSLGTDEEVTYTTLSGDAVSIGDMEGKVRVVNSWASWSPFSKTELPALATLAAEYEDQGVIVVAMNRGEDSIRAEHFLSQIGDLSPLLVLIDSQDSFYDRADGHAMPETLFYDKKGNLIEHVRGAMTIETMRAKLEQVINAN